MRILVHGFIESRRSTERALAAFAGSADVELVGWVARPRFTWIHDATGPDCPRFEEPLPSGTWWTPLDTDPLLGVSVPAADENLRYLLDRETHFSDQYEVTLWRSQILCYAQEILDRTRPEAVLFSDVPHSALSYSLSLCAQARAIPTLHFRTGPAPHLYSFGERVGPSLYAFARDPIADRTIGPEDASEISRAFVDRLAGTYRDAAPSYMRRQLDRQSLSSRALSIARERPREFLSRDAVAKARANLKRKQLRASYEAIAIGADALPADFVALFLHLQPERSTTPEGGFFAQQWLIAHAIASNLPAGWKLVVREHPSTFLTGPRIVRSAGFYEALKRIPGVSLASTTVDPFQLVDSARCVATVTGSVGLEAIARGTPALVFGDATYRGCPGALDVEVPADVATHLDAVARGIDLDSSDVLQYLATFEQSPRVFVSKEHADDMVGAVQSGVAHAGVIERMLEYLATNARMPPG